ncbi:hypothetical protein PBAL39_09851 [Pedobacter sp. BAL39]|uniref:hypothetical protein n=1 Tax=Pedobacter sp. BAL39 TaxID=391596 RepID=UPI000155A0E4|nr:hypothetical protein [Pedobacter sp. BAL39]EDM37438.1 hypothetical protein PBAL39_09851 [Pedobacter sp. BAL39]
MAQENTGNRHAWLKWIAGILAVIFLLIGAAALYFSAKWKPMLSEKLKAGVEEGSGGLYHLGFKDIHLNLITGTASIDEVTLNPDTAVYGKLKAAKLAPAHIFQLSLEKLQLNRLSIIEALFKKRVELNSIVLREPSIQMIHYRVPKKPDTVKEEKTLYELISKTFRSVHVKVIRIEDANFDYVNGADGKKKNSIKHLGITVEDLLIDSLSQTDTTRYYYTKGINFAIIGYESKDKMYTMTADSILGSLAGKRVTVKGFKMIPRYPDLAFSRMFTYGKDRYDLDFKEISLSGLDFVEFNTSGTIHLEALKIGPARAGIFLNREKPAPPGLDKFKNFPHMALRKIPIPTTIDTLKLKNIDVAYTEYNPISQKKGTIYFDRLRGNITHLTNDSSRIAENHFAIAQLKAVVMKKADIDIKINFDLQAPDAAFSYTGKIGPMNMVDLNVVSKPLGLIEIESGKMQGADFSIRANRYGSKGAVNFRYTDLKVKLLKEGEDGNPTKEKGLLSFLANTILIKDANPTKGEAARTANITFERSPAASFFNLLWKGVFIGLRETAGIGIVPVKTPEQGMKKIQQKKEERQEKREKRRAERQKKKEKEQKKGENNDG